MGYKSTLRSINAAGKRAQADARRKQRAEERFQKKLAKIDEKMGKILDALENLYAKGKIDKAEFEKLKQRESDISLDLIVFGKTPGMSLAKRYITGKISKIEFDKVLADILPTEVYLEKKKIEAELFKINLDQKTFRKACKSENGCSHCGVEGSFFNSVKQRDDLVLCRKCFKQYRKMSRYQHEGEYYSVEKVYAPFEGSVQTVINSKHL